MANSEMNSHKHGFYARSVLVALLALAFCALLPLSTAQAKKRKKPNYGTIKIQSNPAGLLLQIDGRPAGETTAEYTAFERLDPGLHRIIIIMPDGQRWSRDIELPAGRIKCVSLHYEPATPPAASPQKARLDNVAVELQNDPSPTTYLIAYGAVQAGDVRPATKGQPKPRYVRQ